MRGNRLIAWTLSAVMAIAPLSACSQQTQSTGVSNEEEMSRELDAETEAGSTNENAAENARESEYIAVATNEKGSYTVTITEANLTYDQADAEEAPGIVTAEEAGVEAGEEMSRNEVDPEESTDAKNGDEQQDNSGDKKKGNKAANTENQGGTTSADEAASGAGLEAQSDTEDNTGAEARADDGEAGAAEQASSDEAGVEAQADDEADDGEVRTEAQADDEADTNDNAETEVQSDANDDATAAESAESAENNANEQAAEESTKKSEANDHAEADSEAAAQAEKENANNRATSEKSTNQEESSKQDATNNRDKSTSDEWSLSKVTKDDVVVCYNVPVPVGESMPAGKNAGENAGSGDATTNSGVPADDTETALGESEVVQTETEFTYETHEAKVTNFANNDGVIDLSFQAEEPGAALTWTYTIRFAGTEAYAVVQTSPNAEDVTIEDVNYDEQVAELSKYTPDFDEQDLALPAGTYIEDGEVIVTEDASEVVQETLLDSGYAESEMSRADENADDAPLDNPGGSDAGDTEDAAVKYMQETNGRKKKYDNWTSVADYGPQIANEIDPRFGQVAELGADAYRLFKAYTTDDWGSGIQGTMGILKMFGLFKDKGSGGVSNAQILSEIQKVGVEVSDMHELTKKMNAELNSTLKQAYANNLQPFDNAVNALHVNAEPLQKMYTEGAIRAAEDGIEPPAEDCDVEDEFEYNYDLTEYIKALEKRGGRKNSAFRGFSEHVQNLTTAFTAVTTEVAKREEFNPVRSYDEYWNLHFNYESEGYYLRQSYRANIKYELKRAFALMEIYYNIFDPYTKGIHLVYNDEYFAAINRLDQMDSGISPEKVRAAAKSSYGTNFRVYAPIFDRTITGMTYASNAKGNTIATGVLEQYCSRLHGKSMSDDLNLAGLWIGSITATGSTGVTTRIDQRWWGDASLYTNGAHGIGFNGNYKDNWYTADIIGYDGAVHVAEKTLHKDGKKLPSPFDKPSSTNWAWSMPYILFRFG